MKRTIRVGLIGAGMAGQAHAFGYRNAAMAPSVAPMTIELHTIADPNVALARTVADRYGFAHAVGDIDELLANPEIDVVSVALPNYLHTSILPRVLASGKHLFAEKPVGRTASEALKMKELADASSAVTGVGFSFRRLPGLAAVQQAVSGGLVGEVYNVRGWYNADYALDANGPLSWRYSQEQSGGGAILDIGAHAIDALQFVAGSISRVLNCSLRTVVPRRPLPLAGSVGHGGASSTELGTVTNDDIAQLTVEFASGAHGQITLSRVAAGIPNSLGVEVFGSAGHVSFDSIAGSEFSIYQNDGSDPAFNGPKRVFTGPQHPYFSDVAAMPGAGVGTGYGEAFIAEIQEFLRCVRDETPMDAGFAEAYKMISVVEAGLRSAASGSPVTVSDVMRELEQEGHEDRREGGSDQNASVAR